MSDDAKLIEIEHTLERADEDLTQLTRAFNEFREASGKEVATLKSENAELRGHIHDCVNAIRSSFTLCFNEHTLSAVHGQQERHHEFALIIRRLAEKFPPKS